MALIKSTFEINDYKSRILNCILYNHLQEIDGHTIAFSKLEAWGDNVLYTLTLTISHNTLYIP